MALKRLEKEFKSQPIQNVIECHWRPVVFVSVSLDKAKIKYLAFSTQFSKISNTLNHILWWTPVIQTLSIFLFRGKKSSPGVSDSTFGALCTLCHVHFFSTFDSIRAFGHIFSVARRRHADARTLRARLIFFLRSARGTDA